mmetsp:Transcript_16980/g.47620  ORF Transcript_16980/g.47620 Transcript_16980/m.47620 type:complete len:215 (+) Transcript_16980:1848-2492(+)
MSHPLHSSLEEELHQWFDFTFCFLFPSTSLHKKIGGSPRLSAVFGSSNFLIVPLYLVEWIKDTFLTPGAIRVRVFSQTYAPASSLQQSSQQSQTTCSGPEQSADIASESSSLAQSCGGIVPTKSFCSSSKSTRAGKSASAAGTFPLSKLPSTMKDCRLEYSDIESGIVPPKPQKRHLNSTRLVGVLTGSKNDSNDCTPNWLKPFQFRSMRKRNP